MEWWKKIVISIVGIIVAAILILVVIPRLLLKYWLFQSLGFEQVFLTNLVTQLALFSVILTIACFLFWIAGRSLGKQILTGVPEIKQRIKEREEKRKKEDWLFVESDEELRNLRERLGIYNSFRGIWAGIAGVIALIFATGVTYWLWFDLLKFLNQTIFRLSDPIFGKDLAFYFFSLPFVSKVLWTALIMGLLLAMVSFFEYTVVSETFERRLPKIPLSWRINWSAIAGIGAGLAWLGRYSILYGSQRVLYGAGYTDVLVWQWFWPILALSLIGVALFCFLAKEDTGLRIGKQPLLIVGVLIGLVIIFGIASGVVWKIQVEPNEYKMEAPYIGNNILFTRYGFSVNEIEKQEYPGTASLNLSVMESPAVKDIRILDYRAVEATLARTQEIRTYYSFPDIDIDRYQIDSEKVQVLVAPREMNIKELPGEARTWVNEKLIYTHGFGSVITPVNQISETGMPVLLVQDIPPESIVSELKISQPRIYYGELTNHYVITNTRQSEFDYPLRKENVFSLYEGTGGIALDSGLKREIAALNFDLLKILFSDDIQPGSRLHIYRNINERIKLITPYLCWDRDNFYFLDKQGIGHWMAMGMVKSNNLPYSEPGIIGKERVSYIRDSVKAIIEPLNGTVNFYVINWEPMIQTYAKIYPAVFKDISEMPEEFKSHLKYPKELFDLQVKKYNIYHMENRSFYGKEDPWIVADEVYYQEKQEVEAYNVLLPIRGEVQFILMKPVTPKEKKILIAWYGVCQDPPHYGKIILYRFPKGRSILGPLLVEAKINQDPIVSQAMTYWGGMGSRVIKGNLLTLPIEGALLFMEPIYIKSEETEGAIPEVKLIATFYPDPSGKETVGLGVNLEKSVKRAIKGKSVSFERLQKERKITIEEIPEVPPEKVKILIVIRDQTGKEIQKIEILPEQRVEIIPTRRG